MNEDKVTENEPLFRTHKTVSVEEIMAAGGPTEYGKKTSKSSQALREAMKNAPPAEPATWEEMLDLLQQLRAVNDEFAIRYQHCVAFGTFQKF